MGIKWRGTAPMTEVSGEAKSSYPRLPEPIYLPFVASSFEEHIDDSGSEGNFMFFEHSSRYKMRWAAAGAAFALCLPAYQAGAVTVSIFPDCQIMEPNETKQFQATVTDATNNAVIWMVDGVKGGAPEMGTITQGGLYTAPANMEDGVGATVTAVSVEDQTEVANVKVCTDIYTRPGNTFYVATTGSNSNAGSEQAPWRTVQYAVDHVEAGDTILVRGGVYNETVIITKSGSADEGYITLTEYPGEDAILDGAGLVTEPYGMRGLINVYHASYVRVKGFELRNYLSNTEFIPAGVIVQGSGERIEIRNNDIHHIEANNLPANGNADASGILVEGTEAAPLRNVIIDGNELHALKTGTSESLTVTGNVEDFQVTRNLVHDNNFIGIDASGYYTESQPDAQSRQGWIAWNNVYSLSTANNQALTFTAAAIAIYVDGGRDITIEGNSADSSDGGIWLLSEHPGRNTSNITVRNNVVRYNQGAGILVGGYSATASGGLENAVIVNNTLLRNNLADVEGINSGELQVSFNARNVVFENNILFASEKGYAITKFSPADSSSVTLGNNIYYTILGAAQTRWFWINTNYYNDGSSPNNFAAFKLASGDSNTSIVADPDFVDEASWNLHLKAGSPGLNSGRFDAGLGVPAVGTRDIEWNPRVIGSTIDRGAYEHAE